MLSAFTRPALRRRLVPFLLVATTAGAFGGLAGLAPAQTSTERDGVALRAAEAQSAADRALAERRRDSVRASRSRQVVARAAQERAAAEAARAQAEAAARAEAEAAARAQAEREAAAAAKAAAEAEARAKAEAAARAKAEAEAAARRRAACPVPNATFTDTYGAARPGGRSHQGTDLMAPHGSPVYAVVSGTVRTASSSAGGISLYIHGDNGETFFYAHNSANVASNGQRVRAGDLVARVGSTGNADGTPHLHLERHVGGRPVNPYAFLRRIC